MRTLVPGAERLLIIANAQGTWRSFPARRQQPARSLDSCIRRRRHVRRQRAVSAAGVVSGL